MKHSATYEPDSHSTRQPSLTTTVVASVLVVVVLGSIGGTFLGLFALYIVGIGHFVWARSQGVSSARALGRAALTIALAMSILIALGLLKALLG